MKLSQNMAKYYVLHYCTSNQFTTPRPKENQRAGTIRLRIVTQAGLPAVSLLPINLLRLTKLIMPLI
jgi:hypothetical protein